jgi:hypothetical protein
MAKNVPNGRNIFQMAIQLANHVHYKTLQNFPKFGFFGLKIYHLATLLAGPAGHASQVAIVLALRHFVMLFS